MKENTTSGNGIAKQSQVNNPHPASPEPINAVQLRWRCPLEWFEFETTDSVPPAQMILGQDDASESLRFGLETRAPGHHIFVRGLAGTGRVTLVWEMMKQIQPSSHPSHDYCFVRNFECPSRPTLIQLPRGAAPEFASMLDEFAKFLTHGLQKALENKTFVDERAALEASFNTRFQSLTEPFESDLKAAGLAITIVDLGTVQEARLSPVFDGDAVPEDSLSTLVEEGKLDQAKADELHESIKKFSQKMSELESKLEEIKIKAAEQENTVLVKHTSAVLRPLLNRVAKKFRSESVKEFLDAILNDITEQRLPAIIEGKDVSRLYRVNPVVSHPAGEPCPIVLESTPTLANLMGTVDREWLKSGASRTDHMMIQPGALLRADGGFLLLEAKEVLADAEVWRALIRTLRTDRIDIASDDSVRPWSGQGLHPHSVPLNTKVILIGDADIFALLDEFDQDFSHLFKVLADFDSTVPRTSASANLYARVLSRIAHDEKLLPFSKEAVAALVEHGARIASGTRRLTARFGRIGDIAREANFVASHLQQPVVLDTHVDSAIQRTKRRGDLPARRYREFLTDGTMQLKLSGSVVGQINGLAVVHAGPLVYGFPQRITATASAGQAGIINIEHESDLSGSIHTKGFYILGGLLREVLAPEPPFAFEASIAFEQSYGGIDGDSASAAEMCSLLSAVTRIPLHQNIAITGAIDQKGHVMAIGAANEKIEGFFDTCAAVGLTGKQGVVIPASNIPDLVLRSDVVDACVDGDFHVRGAATIRDAINVLFDPPKHTETDTYEYVIKIAKAQMRVYWNAAKEPISTR